MMLPHVSLQMQAGAGGAGGGGGGAPPAGPPFNVGLYYYGGSKIGVSWTNGDATASTQLTFTEGAEDPEFPMATRPPGSTTYETTTTGTIASADDGSGTYWWVRHTKNGSDTTWVRSQMLV